MDGRRSWREVLRVSRSGDFSSPTRTNNLFYFKMLLCFFNNKKTSFPFGNDVWTLCVVCFLPSLFSVRYVNRISFGSIFVSYLNLFQIISIIIFGFLFQFYISVAMCIGTTKKVGIHSTIL